MNESQTNSTEANGESVFTNLVLWAAVRCSLQYVVLPFLLPFIRLSDSSSVWLNIGVSSLAIAIMGRNVFRLWNTSWRWRYMIWSLIAISIVIVFLIVDVKILFSQ